MDAMRLPNWMRRPIRREPADPLATELDNWRIVTAVNDERGERAIFRLRMRRPQLANAEAFQFAVRVTWPYESATPMPTPEVAALQNRFDIALDELTGHNGFAEIVRVATGNGVKEWLFYTTDVERFGAEFNRLLEGHPRYPVSLDFEQDPEWSIWSTFVESVERRA